MHASPPTVSAEDRDHVLGPAAAPATLLEYGDYECRYCGAAHVAVGRVLRELRGKVRFVFRHFPLVRLHPNALAAAQAAEAAGLQGRFWQMHDALYRNQRALSREDLLSYAHQLGLDTGAFEAAMADKRVLERIKADFRSGLRIGVEGTPAFYVNGQHYEGSWEDGALEEALLGPRLLR